MSEVEKIFNKRSSPKDGYTYKYMSLGQFKSALTEVAKLVEVTDEEVEDMLLELSESEDGWFDIEYFAAMKSRDLSKTKLEQLLKTK